MNNVPAGCDNNTTFGVLLSDRDLEAVERQQAADARSAELNEALQCITQAAGAMVAASRWEHKPLLMADLDAANGHLRCAHRNAPADTDGRVMRHLRAAQSHVEALIAFLEARR